MPTTTVAPAAKPTAESEAADLTAKAVLAITRLKSARKALAKAAAQRPIVEPTKALDKERRAERQAIQAIRLASSCPADRPAALVLPNGRLAVVLADGGEEADPIDFFSLGGQVVIVEANRVVDCRNCR